MKINEENNKKQQKIQNGQEENFFTFRAPATRAKKRASLELCVQLASRRPVALGRQVFSTLGFIKISFENIEKMEKIYENI